MATPWRTLAIVPFTLTILSVLFTTPAAAGPCGDGSGPGGADVPCACGDVVVTDTVLDATDPVTSTACGCDGPFGAALTLFGVKLDLGGHTLQGIGYCAGIRVYSGNDVGHGRITGFAAGVLGDFEPVGNRIHHIQVVDNGDHGIYLVGDHNTVDTCIVSRNAGEGIALPGSDNFASSGNVVRDCRVEGNGGHGIRVSFNNVTVEGNYVRDNRGDGITVSGFGGQRVTLNRSERNAGSGFVIDSTPIPGEWLPAVVARNWATENAWYGFSISGNDVVLDRNRASYNHADGYTLSGHSHEVTLNTSTASDSVGFHALAGDSLFQGNRSAYDKICVVDTTGTNTYIGNRCTSPRLFPSDPPGLWP